MRKLRMLASQPGATDETGNRVRTFVAGEVYSCGVDLPASVCTVFVREGWAEWVETTTETKPAAAPETKPAGPAEHKRRGRGRRRGE